MEHPGFLFIIIPTCRVDGKPVAALLKLIGRDKKLSML